jgi:cell wall-associated NlpC family hydrolase
MRVSVMGRVVLAVVGLSVGVLVPAVSATASTPPTGQLYTVRQNTFTHRLHITGWAYDPARPRAAVTVRLYVDGSFATRVRADDPSPDADRKYHVSGDHGYDVTITRKLRVGRVTAKSRGADPDAALTTLAVKKVNHYYPPPGSRILYIAKRYVGARYVEGGASPSGFDCSGYTKYAYGQAHVRNLVHNAEAQRQGMRSIARSRARPGDLVFYMRSGSAYHVAVYAGRGWQYAAATVKDGVRYQRVWSATVRYGTDWH